MPFYLLMSSLPSCQTTTAAQLSKVTTYPPNHNNAQQRCKDMSPAASDLHMENSGRRHRRRTRSRRPPPPTTPAQTHTAFATHVIPRACRRTADTALPRGGETDEAERMQPTGQRRRHSGGRADATALAMDDERRRTLGVDAAGYQHRAARAPAGGLLDVALQRAVGHVELGGHVAEDTHERARRHLQQRVRRQAAQAQEDAVEKQAALQREELAVGDDDALAGPQLEPRHRVIEAKLLVVWLRAVAAALHHRRRGR